MMKLTYIGEAFSYNVEISAIQENVIQALGPNLVMKEGGFILTDDFGNEYDYSAYATIYRIVDGGFQYSNDGSVWVEPTKTVIVQVAWDDNDDEKHLRPSSVKVGVFDDGSSIGTVTLNAKNGWTKEYTNVPETHEYSVSAPDVRGYDTVVEGTDITYEIQQAYEPTVEEQLEELNIAIIDLDQRVYALEERSN